MNAPETTGFRPAWWCRNAHLQTIWPTLLRRRPRVETRPERVLLPDGDFLDLAWTAETGPDAPIVVVLHGLEGSLESKYAAGMLAALHRARLTAVLMHFRGCSGEPNRARRNYHSGETTDLDWFVSELQRRHPQRALAVVGFSLGGNVLLKWLGERGATTPVAAAVAVSVPFDLGRCADRLEHGFSRLYQARLLISLRANLRRKFAGRGDSPVPMSAVASLRSFREFDDAVTAPLHGFASAADYYAKSSCRGFLRHVQRPTLIVHSADDPFVYPDVMPTAAGLTPWIEFDRTTHGGHVGFVSGRSPFSPRYWLESRVPQWLAAQFARETVSSAAEPSGQQFARA